MRITLKVLVIRPVLRDWRKNRAAGILSGGLDSSRRKTIRHGARSARQCAGPGSCRTHGFNARRRPCLFMVWTPALVMLSGALRSECRPDVADIGGSDDRARNVPVRGARQAARRRPPILTSWCASSWHCWPGRSPDFRLPFVMSKVLPDPSR